MFNSPKAVGNNKKTHWLASWVVPIFITVVATLIAVRSFTFGTNDNLWVPNEIPPKLALGFIMGQHIHHPKAWQAWINEAIGWESRRFHCKPSDPTIPRRLVSRFHSWTLTPDNVAINPENFDMVNAELPPFLANRGVPIHDASTWHNLSGAILYLFEDFLKDPDVRWICLVSESHVPLRPFSHLYGAVLAAGDVTWYKEMIGFESAKNWLVNPDGVLSPKAEVWSIYSRKHAKMIVDHQRELISYTYEELKFAGDARWFVLDEANVMHILSKVLGPKRMRREVIPGYPSLMCWRSDNDQLACGNMTGKTTNHRPVEFLEFSVEKWQQLVANTPETFTARKFLRDCQISGWPGKNDVTTFDEYLAAQFDLLREQAAKGVASLWEW